MGFGNWGSNKPDWVPNDRTQVLANLLQEGRDQADDLGDDVKGPKLPLPPAVAEAPTGYDLHEFTRDELFDLAKQPGSVVKNCLITSCDRHYIAVSQKFWEEIFAAADEISYQYMSQYRDCDDFSFYLKGFCAMKYGVNGVSTALDKDGLHSYNVVMVALDDGSLEFRVVEPQRTGNASLEWVPQDQLFQGYYTLSTNCQLIW